MTTLAAISLLAPAMLGGLALVTLPIAAHLLNRRARRRVVFPSIVLLAQTKASQSLLFRLRRLLLLAMRCLAVTMIVLAFAQPVWERDATASAEGAGDDVTVLLLDASASVAQRADGVAVFEALRAAGARALDEATGAGDAVNVIVAEARPRAVFPKATRNIDAVRQALERAVPTSERADIGAALARTGQMLGEHKGRRRLAIASDFQAGNWAELAARLNAMPLPPGTTVTLIPPQSEAEANLAIVGVRSRPSPALARRRAELVVTVANFGERDAVARPRAFFDDVEASAAEGLVEPWQVRELVLSVAPERAGEHRVRVELPGDALEADNAWAHVLRATADRRVVLIADDDAADAGTGSYYVERALAPKAEAGGGVTVDVVRSGDVNDEALAGASTVFVSYVSGLSDAVAAALLRHVRAGGGLVVFGAAGPADRTLAALDRAEPRGATPWRLAGLRDLDDSRPSLTIASGNWTAPLLGAFDERSQDALARAQFTRVWATEDVRPEAKVLLWFDDGTPALAELPVGRGRVVVANFGADPLMGDLAKHGCFVALVQSLFEELQPADDRGGDAFAGQALAMRLPKERAAAGVSLFGPGRRPVGVFDVSSGEHGVVVSLPRAAQAGFYEARAADQVIGIAAANVDPRESDLRRIDPAVVRAWFGDGGAVAAVAAGDDASGGRATSDKPAWGWMLAIAVAVLAVEMALLSVWRR